MHNKSNETITQVTTTDVPQYFRDIIESPHNYGLRLYMADTDTQASLAIVKTYSSEPVRMAITATQSEQLWSYIVESPRELQDRYDILIQIRELGAGSRSLFVTKNTRMSAADLIAKKSLTQEGYDFLATAYKSGINILIEGATGSGRTRFLNTLMDSSKDYRTTVLLNSVPETFFGFDHSEITEIRSENPARLLPQLLSVSHPRMVLDDTPLSEPVMRELVKKADTGTQIVATGYRSLSVTSALKDDFLSSFYVGHPFELRVHVKTDWNCYEKRFNFTVLSVEQIIQQKVGNRVEPTNRMLFSTYGKVAEPTRTLRRKMDSYGQKSNQQTSSLSPVPDVDEIPALVSITAEQKEQLQHHRKALRAHFRTQSPSLRQSFAEIDKILDKF